MQSKIVVLILMFWVSNIAIAKDFGTSGATFPIAEEGFVAMLKRRLGNIDIAEHQQKMQELVKKNVNEPKPVEGITRASKTRSHSYDPTYILDKNVYLPCGKLVHPMGTSVNPLDHMSWSGKMVFIDGRDREQIEWVIKYYSNINSLESSDNKVVENVKIVLVAGRPLELEDELKQNIYFDQFGELTGKFNIEHVPAIAEQDGKFLKITEINI